MRFDTVVLGMFFAGALATACSTRDDVPAGPSASSRAAAAASDAAVCMPQEELESCGLEEWCDEHGVAEADCKLCNPSAAP